MSDPTSIAAVQNIAQQIALLNQTLGQVFPGATTVSTNTVATLVSSNITGSISIISASGAMYMVALYST